MNKYANTTGIPLSVAVWLATDEYDHNDNPKQISVTGLLKPIKEIILTMQMQKADEQPIDISTRVASRIGTAIHNSIEFSWKTNYKTALLEMGYPKGLINTVRINPTKEELAQYKADGVDITPVYTEVRINKEFMGWIISGERDFLADGRVEDFKSTSVYSYTSGSNDEKYILQGSMYRWLDPETITQDIMAIQFIFLDWKAFEVKRDKDYPPSKTYEHKLPLMDLNKTEHFIANKLHQIETLANATQEVIPPCTNKDLWRKETVWKYYKNPAKKTRSTKNFDNAIAAHTRLAADKHVGVIDEVKGEVVACKYCNVFGVCKQAEQLILSGDIKT